MIVLYSSVSCFNLLKITFADVNECIEQTDNCHTFATCINLENGGFECVCQEGYKGNGLQCSGRVCCAICYIACDLWL